MSAPPPSSATPSMSGSAAAPRTPGLRGGGADALDKENRGTQASAAAALPGTPLKPLALLAAAATDILPAPSLSPRPSALRPSSSLHHQQQQQSAPPGSPARSVGRVGSAKRRLSSGGLAGSSAPSTADISAGGVAELPAPPTSSRSLSALLSQEVKRRSEAEAERDSLATELSKLRERLRGEFSQREALLNRLGESSERISSLEGDLRAAREEKEQLAERLSMAIAEIGSSSRHKPTEKMHGFPAEVRPATDIEPARPVLEAEGVEEPGDPAIDEERMIAMSAGWQALIELRSRVGDEDRELLDQVDVMAVALQEEVEELSRSKADKESELRDSYEVIEALEGDISTLRTQNRDLGDTIETLEAMGPHRGRDRSGDDGAVVAAPGAPHSSAPGALASRDDLLELEEEIVKLTRELGDKCAEVSTLQAEVAELRREVRDCHDLIAALEGGGNFGSLDDDDGLVAADGDGAGA
ncbi:hypothetical protein HK405_015467 [Cladochytrium tenue]|nr:hypothetical protein HK405_015467 [Cladochytrium tenue]